MATEPITATQLPGSGRARRRWSNLGSYTLLTALSILILFPIYTTFVRAISDPVVLLNKGSGLKPMAPDWGVFGRVLAEPSFRSAMWRSTVTSLIIVAGQTVTSILAAYAFVFIEMPLKRLLFGLTITTLLLPIEVTLVANIETIRDLDLFNTYRGLALPFLAWAFGIFLLRQAFLGIPGDLRDAATLDGYGHLRFLWKVVLPISRPVLGSFVLIAFLSAWNQYLWPRFASDKSDWQTIQVALRTLGRQEIGQLNFGFAASLLSAVPLVVLLIVFQKQIVRGLTAGAVKG